jgi:hypothetical protein
MDEIERIRQVHGEEAARVAERFLAKEPQRNPSRNMRNGWRVGVKPKPRKGIPRTVTHGPNWKDLKEMGGWNGQPTEGRRLPRSGAPLPPKPRPR